MPTKISVQGICKGFPTDNDRLEVIQDLNFEVNDS